MNTYDFLIIGGGINGAAIARDAAGRGHNVLLVEKDDLASHTSSASSKLVHGGLRYLEHRAFRLVRESLHEREVLLRTAPHIVRPLRFIMPSAPDGRPWWMLRFGLFLYGVLAGKSRLPRPALVSSGDPAAAPLKGQRRLASYWDAWADDARLTVLNAVDAAEHGAEICTRTEMLSAKRSGAGWAALLSNGRTVQAKQVVNAAGPWVAEVLGHRLGIEAHAGVRLVRGIHVAVPRLYAGDHAYILQNRDGRVVFALPYGALTLLGTTDTNVDTPEQATVEQDDVAYLCGVANGYFECQTGPQDVRWSYAGVRALYDDGAKSAKDVTRDYRLELDADGTLLSVFGGKLTTARALAEEALAKLKVEGAPWTATAPLPGGDVDPEFEAWLDGLVDGLGPERLGRMREAYGTRLARLLSRARSPAALGRDFGAGLSEAEVRYLVAEEFARTTEDVLWRRTKLGLSGEVDEAGLTEFLAERAMERLRRDNLGGPMPLPRTIGWLVDELQRVELLQQFRPRYANVVAHHVTLASSSTDDLPQPAIGEIIGIADDGEGVEALVVSMGGTTDRPGGGTYHITWSLADGRRAKESNDVIGARGWAKLPIAEPVTLHPSNL